jgi:hypothetical protein
MELAVVVLLQLVIKQDQHQIQMELVVDLAVQEQLQKLQHHH